MMRQMISYLLLLNVLLQNSIWFGLYFHYVEFGGGLLFKLRLKGLGLLIQMFWPSLPAAVLWLPAGHLISSL